MLITVKPNEQLPRKLNNTEFVSQLTEATVTSVTYGRRICRVQDETTYEPVVPVKEHLTIGISKQAADMLFEQVNGRKPKGSVQVSFRRLPMQSDLFKDPCPLPEDFEDEENL